MPTQRILVKARGAVPDATLSLGATSVHFSSTPLFESIGRAEAFGAAPVARWHVLTLPLALDEANPWDACHALLRQGFGVAGTEAPEFAEPDLPQKWLAGDEADLPMMLGAS